MLKLINRLVKKYSRAIYLAFALLVTSVISHVSLAANNNVKSIEKRLSVADDVILIIENERGQIDIEGWTENQVMIEGTLDVLAKDILIDQDDFHVFVKVEVPKIKSAQDRRGSNLKIRVPQGSKIVFKGVGTALSVKNIKNELNLESQSGDVTLDKITGRVLVKTVSGRVNAKDVQGVVDISTVNGNVAGNVDSHYLKVSSVKGKIDLKLKVIDRVEISNVSGESMIYGDLSINSFVEMTSVDGQNYLYPEQQPESDVYLFVGQAGKSEIGYTVINPFLNDYQSWNQLLKAGDIRSVIKLSTVSGVVGIRKKAK